MPVLKKGSAEAKRFMAKIRALKNKPKKVAGVVKKVVKKKVVRQTGTSNIEFDKLYKAKKPGKRVTPSGSTYYENRANRSDKNKLLGIGGVGAMQKDFSTKYNIVIHQLARVKGEIASLKELLKHEPTKLPNKKAKLKAQIKEQQISLKYLSSMKTKLAKLK